MNKALEFNKTFEQAERLITNGRLQEAEEKFQSLLSTGQHREEILRALVDLYLHGRQAGKAIETLVALTEEVPDRLYYYSRLGALLDGIGETAAAITHYQRLLRRQPRLAEAHFNLALLYKRCKRYAEAVTAYETAINLGIKNVQEVYSNMGVLYSEMRQKDKAIAMYDRALEIDKKYLPAWFNKAGILEESGQRQQARDIYKRILEQDPRHWDSLARLAHIDRVTSNDKHLITALQQAVVQATDNPQAREGLYFALGKALDDTGQYEQAFDAYRTANEMGRIRNPPYDEQVVERYFNAQIKQFSGDVIQNKQSTLAASPIFVCGMFRSGSTLIEQILGSHPEITSGGELDFMPWLASTRLMPWPQKLMEANRQDLVALANEYLSHVHELFPDAKNITDKKPDNFLLLGLIKILFPAARIVYTRRNPSDNCLSVYFQQLGGNLNYATDLKNIAHYYNLHVRLMRHWTDCFPDNIFTVDYDELVQSPEPVLRQLLDFLGLEWSDRCLAFNRTANLVQTASVWQVREELHTRSSGRWQNYANFVPGIQSLFDKNV
ncbi:MAG: hypothetical protein HW386_2079 [Gammaproteobacteria bacterium]|nr:hypothetical protein [Gammaproteobacteria bacterium]